MPMPTYYELLEIEPNATSEQIKAAWKRFAHGHHPDHGDENGAATERFKQVNAAYECLSDPDKRKAYDATLRSRTTAGRETPRQAPKRQAPKRQPTPTSKAHPGDLQPWPAPQPPAKTSNGDIGLVVGGLVVGGLLMGGLLAAGNYAPKDASGRRRDRHTGRYRSGPFW